MSPSEEAIVRRVERLEVAVRMLGKSVAGLRRDLDRATGSLYRIPKNEQEEPS